MHPAVEAELPAPDTAEEKAYLGIPGDAETFTLDQVQADILVVEVFDMYCHLCQKAAVSANALYEEIGKSPHRDRIKMIAVGKGNTPLEVGVYKRQFKAPFPMLADPEKKLDGTLEYGRVPQFIGLKRTDQGTFREVYRHTGYFTKPATILKRLLRRAGNDK
jgi:hypothetical protein